MLGKNLTFLKLIDNFNQNQTRFTNLYNFGFSNGQIYSLSFTKNSINSKDICPFYDHFERWAQNERDHFSRIPEYKQTSRYDLMSFMIPIYIKRKQKDMIYVAEYFLVGSRFINEVRLMKVYTHEIVRIYRFQENQNTFYEGGFIDATCIGDFNIISDILFTKVVLLLCTDGYIRQINLQLDL